MNSATCAAECPQGGLSPDSAHTAEYAVGIPPVANKAAGAHVLTIWGGAFANGGRPGQTPTWSGGSAVGKGPDRAFTPFFHATTFGRDLTKRTFLGRVPTKV